MSSHIAGPTFFGPTFFWANFYDFPVATGQSISTRARDSDRSNTCQMLDTALGEGQLSMEEHRQRVGAATNAATLGELCLST
jgi:hypothetical protein